jgi:hypothetical protein
MSDVNIEQLENAAELLAILVARYFATLIRENTPSDVAGSLTMRYQIDMLALFTKPKSDA